MAEGDQFKSCLQNYLQTLCHSCLNFDIGIEIEGYIKINIDNARTIGFDLNDRVQKIIDTLPLFDVDNLLSGENGPNRNQFTAVNDHNLQRQTNNFGIRPWNTNQYPFCKTPYPYGNMGGALEQQTMPENLVFQRTESLNQQEQRVLNQHIRTATYEAYSNDNSNSEVGFPPERSMKDYRMKDPLSTLTTQSVDVQRKPFAPKHVKKYFKSNSGESPYKCEICQSTFARSDGLKVHTRIHTGEKPYKCEICSRSFRQQNALKGHYAMHTGEKPYKCSICEAAFTSYRTLLYHTRHHNNEKPFKCDICETSYTNTKSLRKHMHKHNDDKLFRFKNRFKNKAKFYRPNRPVKTENELDSSDGSDAEETDSKSPKVKRQSRSSDKNFTGFKPYTCDTCGLGFNDSKSLRRHKVTHTQDKPHSCDICGKRFMRLDKLKYHLVVHTGIRKYKCKYCDKRFSASKGLIRHTKIHTRKFENTSE